MSLIQKFQTGKGAFPISAKGNGGKRFSELPTLKEPPAGKTAEELCKEALALSRCGKHNRAVEKAKKAKRREPENARTYNISGICVHKSGESHEKDGFQENAKDDYKKAADDYSKAITLEPGCPGFYSNRANVLSNLAKIMQNTGKTAEAESLRAQSKSDEKTAGALRAEIEGRMKQKTDRPQPS